jgi:hypothetical protein
MACKLAIDGEWRFNRGRLFVYLVLIIAAFFQKKIYIYLNIELCVQASLKWGELND